jgi:hypothetical protein
LTVACRHPAAQTSQLCGRLLPSSGHFPNSTDSPTRRQTRHASRELRQRRSGSPGRACFAYASKIGPATTGSTDRSLHRRRNGVDCASWSRQASHRTDRGPKKALLGRPGTREGAPVREERGSRIGNAPIDSLVHRRRCSDWRAESGRGAAYPYTRAIVYPSEDPLASECEQEKPQ